MWYIPRRWRRFTRFKSGHFGLNLAPWRPSETRDNDDSDRLLAENSARKKSSRSNSTNVTADCYRFRLMCSCRELRTNTQTRTSSKTVAWQRRATLFTKRRDTEHRPGRTRPAYSPDIAAIRWTQLALLCTFEQWTRSENGSITLSWRNIFLRDEIPSSARKMALSKRRRIFRFYFFYIKTWLKKKSDYSFVHVI